MNNNIKRITDFSKEFHVKILTDDNCRSLADLSGIKQLQKNTQKDVILNVIAFPKA